MATINEIVTELEAFYKGYIDSFNREDIDMYSQSFDYPYAMILGDKGLALTRDETAHQRFYTSLMINLKERGWVRSGIDQFKAWPYADNLALIMADAIRYRADGSVIEKVRATYTVRRAGNNWKIVALAMVTPPFLGPGEIPRR
jgi:NTF2-like protein (DUF6841)